MSEDKNMENAYLIEFTRRIVLEQSDVTVSRISAIIDERIAGRYVNNRDCESRRIESENKTAKQYKTLLILIIIALVLAGFAAGIKSIELLSKLQNIRSGLGV
ncbi:MAG: hypothetical protein NTV01_00425 [Bacteroidia bacterium]|nr:hypothetical protein [Bacteroidia bacterium]